MKRIVIAVLVLLALGGLFLWLAQKPERWALYYANTLPAESFQPFDLIVFDRESHPPLDSLKTQHKTLLGYLSLGEAETFRETYFQYLKDHQLLVEMGPEWKGNPIIDSRKPEWIPYVLDVIIPAILKQGFDGVMIDTADSTIYLENNNPQTYGGLKQSFVGTVKAIRARYPKIKIMLNRGFDLLPDLGGDIDMLLAESTFSSWNEAQRECILLTTEQRQHYLTILEGAQRGSHRLKIYTLDYWPADDAARIKDIYERQREKGFIPYVTTFGVQTIAAEPK